MGDHWDVWLTSFSIRILIFNAALKAKWTHHNTKPGVATTSRVRTGISPGSLAAIDSCLGLVRPHQHGIAKVPLKGVLKNTCLVSWLCHAYGAQQGQNNCQWLPMNQSRPQSSSLLCTLRDRRALGNPETKCLLIGFREEQSKASLIGAFMLALRVSRRRKVQIAKLWL